MAEGGGGVGGWGGGGARRDLNDDDHNHAIIMMMIISSRPLLVVHIRHLITLITDISNSNYTVIRITGMCKHHFKCIDLIVLQISLNEVKVS